MYISASRRADWTRTLLIITYDEHGGTLRSCLTARGEPPGPPYQDGFTFNRFGVRVPP